MPSEMKKHIKGVENFQKNKVTDVIISYDVMPDESAYAKYLLKLIKDTYEGKLITKSNYRITALSDAQIETLKKEIVDNHSKILKESAGLQETKVVIIIPEKDRFSITTLIDEKKTT